MATSPNYITYVCDQLAGFQPLRYRKMFGEYMVYLSDRPILTVCDNTVYVKMYPELAQLLDSASFDCGLSHIHQLAAPMFKAQGPSEE